ncbi:MAG: glucosaminidase domain-containing protein [Lachnospiraceae bacterium]
MATKEQVSNFITMIAPIAQEKAKGRGRWSLPSVCIAQCCCESAYGTQPKMTRANAVLGIKVGKSKAHFGKAWKDQAYSTRTKECYDGKTHVNIQDMFRAYDSVADAIEDYYDMLSSCSRYRGCLNCADPQTCISAIKNGGYATDPTYIKTIMSIIRTNNLTRYDSVVTGASGVTEGGVKEYSLAADGEMQIARNFRVKEFRCKDGSDRILIDVGFVQDKLQPIRDHFGGPVTFNSAYRTPEHNLKVKGAKYSYHLQGRAFDIVVRGHTPLEVAKYAQTLGIQGIIQYNGFVHVDSRETKYWARNDNGKVTVKKNF